MNCETGNHCSTTEDKIDSAFRSSLRTVSEGADGKAWSSRAPQAAAVSSPSTMCR